MSVCAQSFTKAENSGPPISASKSISGYEVSFDEEAAVLEPRRYNREVEVAYNSLTFRGDHKQNVLCRNTTPTSLFHVVVVPGKKRQF